MTVYASNELISSSEFAKKFGTYLSQVQTHAVEKIAILKNNNIEAISLSACKPNRLPYKPDLKEDLAHYYPKIHKLLEFQNAKSLSKKTHSPVRADNLGGKDYCFWAIKLYTEDLIREFGEGTPVPTHLVEDWAYTQFSDHKKGISTVRAKCRSVWHWNDKRDWVLPKHYIKKNQKEVLMTRQERALKNTEMMQIESQTKVINAITGLMSNTYKKKNGKWHIGLISDALNMSRTTVSKYIKLYEDQ